MHVIGDKTLIHKSIGKGRDRFHWKIKDGIGHWSGHHGCHAGTGSSPAGQCCRDDSLGPASVYFSSDASFEGGKRYGRNKARRATILAASWPSMAMWLEKGYQGNC